MKTNLKTHEFKLTTDSSLPWKEAVLLCKDTYKDLNVWKVGDLYPSGTKETVDFVIVNFGDKNSFSKALEYAKENNLGLSTPRDVFHCASLDLSEITGMNYGWLTSTTECVFDGYQRACCVWWGGAGRGARLGWVGGFGGSVDWFLFRKSSALSTLSPSPESLSSLTSLESAIAEVKKAGYVIYKQTNEK